MQLKIIILSIYIIIYLLDFPIIICDNEEKSLDSSNENKILGSILFISFIIFWFKCPNIIDILFNANDIEDVTDLFVAEPKPLKTFGKEVMDIPKEEIVKITIEIIYPENKN